MNDDNGNGVFTWKKIEWFGGCLDASHEVKKTLKNKMISLLFENSNMVILCELPTKRYQCFGEKSEIIDLFEKKGGYIVRYALIPRESQGSVLLIQTGKSITKFDYLKMPVVYGEDFKYFGFLNLYQEPKPFGCELCMSNNKIHMTKVEETKNGNSDINKYRVICCECGLSGPWMKEYETAVSVWNSLQSLLARSIKERETEIIKIMGEKLNQYAYPYRNENVHIDDLLQKQEQ